MSLFGLVGWMLDTWWIFDSVGVCICLSACYLVCDLFAWLLVVGCLWVWSLLLGFWVLICGFGELWVRVLVGFIICACY